jgi:hypothetical protein
MNIDDTSGAFQLNISRLLLESMDIPSSKMTWFKKKHLLLPKLALAELGVQPMISKLLQN